MKQHILVEGDAIQLELMGNNYHRSKLAIRVGLLGPTQHKTIRKFFPQQLVPNE